MARRFAPLLTAIWDDDDFCALSPEAQRMYMQVLSQKRLSLCGVLPYTPRNLARGCKGMTVADVENALGQLVEANYIMIDESTDELLVRTILKHDPPRGAKVLQGMWADWTEIDSERFRHHVVHSLSEELWGWQGVKIPESAKALRNTLFPEPPDTPSTERNQSESEPLASSGLRPPASDPLPASSSLPNAHLALVRADDDGDFRQAIRLITDHRCQGRTFAKSERGYRATVEAEATNLDGDWVRRLLANGATPESAAEAVTTGIGDPIEPPAKRSVPWCGPDCETCEGTAFVETDAGWVECPERKRATA